ncbi:MAG: hypothetical protein AB1403_26230, partial [Candidatus Riflebacteria bacterium]
FWLTVLTFKYIRYCDGKNHRPAEKLLKSFFRMANLLSHRMFYEKKREVIRNDSEYSRLLRYQLGVLALPGVISRLKESLSLFEELCENFLEDTLYLFDQRRWEPAMVRLESCFLLVRIRPEAAGHFVALSEAIRWVRGLSQYFKEAEYLDSLLKLSLERMPVPARSLPDATLKMWQKKIPVTIPSGSITLADVYREALFAIYEDGSSLSEDESALLQKLKTSLPIQDEIFDQLKYEAMAREPEPGRVFNKIDYFASLCQIAFSDRLVEQEEIQLLIKVSELLSLDASEVAQIIAREKESVLQFLSNKPEGLIQSLAENWRVALKIRQELSNSPLLPVKSNELPSLVTREAVSSQQVIIKGFTKLPGLDSPVL